MQTAADAGLAASDVPKLALKWSFGFPAASVAWSQPTVSGGRVFVGSQNGTVYALDARTGCIRWTYGARGGVRTAVAIGPAAGPAPAVAYFGDTAANLTTRPTLSTAALAGSAVGSYTVTAAGAADGDYTFQYVTGTLTVLAAPLVVTANSRTAVYGSAFPAFTVSYSGLVNGDTPASLGALPAVTNTALPRSPVGTYTLSAAGATSSNYTITFVPANFSITARPVTVTVDSGQTKVFGAADPVFTYESSELGVSFTAALSRAAGENVGTYAITHG
jgi:outer membrane protein assembly factor BamB